MKYVFFGTPRFAEIVLDGLIQADMPPIAIVCNPDRPVGRKKVITAPPTKERVKNYEMGGKEKIEILQPEKLDEDFIKTLRSLDADLFVVAAYAKIIPQTILDIPRFGTIGAHPSLLPKYRGASPLQSAILADETQNGATIYLMDAKTDHGPIIAQAILENPDLHYLAFEEAMAKLSAQLLLKTIPSFSGEKIPMQTQDETEATFTKKFKTEDGFIDGAELEAAEHGNSEKAKTILRKINALNPEPGAWTTRMGKRVKLLEAEIRSGSLRLMKIQEEGQRPRVV